MSDYYELIGQTAVRMSDDVLTWARQFETVDRRVAQTKLFGFVFVSTVFLGLDHAFGGPPQLFESMAFWRGEGGYEQERCSTWLEAQEQHARMCAEVARPASVMRYGWRQAREWWDRARRDLQCRWRELRGIEPTEIERMYQSIEQRVFDQGDW